MEEYHTSCRYDDGEKDIKGKDKAVTKTFRKGIGYMHLL